MSIAEDVLTGLQCSHCGVCFEEESGFPVLCKKCYKEQLRAELAHKKGKLRPFNHIPKSKFKEL